MDTTADRVGIAAAQPAIESWTAPVIPIEKGAAMSTPERRPSTQPAVSDGMSIRIPLRDIIQILTALFAIAAIVWTLRSDIRDLKTSMDYQNEMQKSRADALSEDVKTLQREQKLQSIDINDVKISLARAGVNTTGQLTVTNQPTEPRRP